ncbi:hypothetical protein ABGB12_26880 [Actinocorallia sp. B10E7]|uniref:hypothetical protein n=1 Tax=Actinocorallia sp. B10E7 TaxID=3153558 RepID=UPI00325C4828
MDVEKVAAHEGEQERGEEAAGVRPRWRWPATVGRVVGIGLVVVFAVIGVVATGYVVWNGFPQGKDRQAEACADDLRAAKSFQQRVLKIKDARSPEAEYQGRLWARVIAGAPECFNPGDVAAAREYLDRG